MLLLVVGCINRYDPPADGWQVVHVDKSDRGIWDPIVGNLPIDIQADMRSLPIETGTVDRLQCWHALEHVNEQGGKDAIEEFARVLTPDGVLDIRVPDLEYVQRAKDITTVLHLLYGDQMDMPDADLNVHQWGYSERTLRALLAEFGFVAERIKAQYPDEIHLLARRATTCN